MVWLANMAIPVDGLGELLKRPKSLIDFMAKVHFEPFVQFSFASQAKVLEYFFTLEKEKKTKIYCVVYFRSTDFW